MRYEHEPNTYKGYKYEPWVEDDGDCRKTFHDVRGPNGENLCLPLSPYAGITNHFFKLWVDAGCPYPESQRITTEELEDMIADKILLEDDL